MGFATENDLVQVALESHSLREAICADFGWQTLVEPRGLFGRPDLVYSSINCGAGGTWFCDHSTAIEAKLRDWRRAMIQAFRYRSFAHTVYVLLDQECARAAAANLPMFQRANVGLLTIDNDGQVVILHQAMPEPPYCERMAERLLQLLLQDIETNA